MTTTLPTTRMTKPLPLAPAELECLAELVLNPENAMLPVALLHQAPLSTRHGEAETRVRAALESVRDVARSTGIIPDSVNLLDEAFRQMLLDGRPDWDRFFYGIALAASVRSTCLRASVGAVLARPDDHVVVGVGYNGAPPGEDHCLDVGCDMEDGHCQRSIHAEVNAIAHAGRRARGTQVYIVKRNMESAYGSSTGIGPCRECRKVLRANRVEVHPSCDE